MARSGGQARGKRGPGRPSLFDAEYDKRRKAFVTFVRTGNSVKDAAEASDLGRSTVLAALAEGQRLKAKRRDRCTDAERKYRDFADEVRKAKAQAKALLVSRLYAWAEQKPSVALAILRARHPAEWNPNFMAKVMALMADMDPEITLPGVKVTRERAKDREGAA